MATLSITFQDIAYSLRLGMWWRLLWPRLRSLAHRLGRARGKERLRTVFFIVVGILFWVGTFIAFYRVLIYFRGIEAFGDLLAGKLLSMVFLTFFALLIFSNIVTALSSYFLSDDLNLILAMPVPLGSIYLSKFVETIMDSSWMVLMFGTPVFIVYGVVFKAGLGYYLLLPLVIVPFLLIPAALGIGAIMVLVNLFPARRTRDILLWLSIFFVIGIYLMIRFLQPERLVDPEAFSGLMAYFHALKAPSTPLLPSYWATQSLLPILMNYEGETGFYVLMLWSTALAIMVLGERLAHLLYLSGWSKAQEGKRARLSRSGIINAFVALVTTPFPAHTRPIVEKDIKTFFRDSTQWSQIFLLGALIVVYLYNFASLPLERAPIPTFYLQNLISFLNMGLAGFVLSAISVRFVYPAVSIEGDSFWILRSSPLNVRQFLWCKFWMSLIPLLILSEVLIVVSNYLLKATPFMKVLSAVTILFTTFGITSLGMGIGAMYPRFRVENVAHIASGFGGMLYMILTMIFIGLVVVLEAFPVYMIFMARIQGISLDAWHWTVIVGCFVMLLVIQVLAFVLPMRLGIRALERMEEV